MGEARNDAVVVCLADKRARAKRQAERYLWENLQLNTNWRGSAELSEKEKVEEKIKIQEAHWHPVFVDFLNIYSQTLYLIAPDDVGEVLQYGGGRRLFSIYRSLKVISKTAHWGREEVLSGGEKGALDDALMLFYVHVMGFFDALAIAFYRRFLIAGEFEERRSDLLSKEFRSHIASDELDSIMLENDVWFQRIKDDYRNRYVHRVPPYVAPATLSREDVAEFNRLESEKSNALREGSLDVVDRLAVQQDQLGKFHPFFSFTETDGHTPILSTVLDDALRFQVIALSVFETFVPRLDLRDVKQQS